MKVPHQRPCLHGEHLPAPFGVQFLQGLRDRPRRTSRCSASSMLPLPTSLAAGDPVFRLSDGTLARNYGRTRPRSRHPRRHLRNLHLAQCRAEAPCLQGQLLAETRISPPIRRLTATLSTIRTRSFSARSGRQRARDSRRRMSGRTSSSPTARAFGGERHFGRLR